MSSPTRWFPLFWLALVLLVALSLPAGATPLGARVTLEDGPRSMLLERIGPAQGGLAPLRLSHPATGRVTTALVGRTTLIRVSPDADPTAIASRLGVRVLRSVMPSLGLWLVEDTGSDDGMALATRLQKSNLWRRELLGAYPDLYLQHKGAQVREPPNDPRYPGQWFLSRIGIEDAWRIESGTPDVGITINDTGCDIGHQDLKDKLDPGLDVVDGDDDPSFAPSTNGNAHGTACAGLVAASTDNAEGVAGTCPGCRLRCVRLLSPSGMVAISSDVEAFQFVLDSGAAVSSNSWGFVNPTPVPEMLRMAIEEAHDKGRGGKGAIIVFAAGNDDRRLGNDEIEAVRGVINVGAVNNFGEVTQFSNSGDSVDVVAPTGTLTTDIRGAAGDNPGDYTTSFGGTSSACPLVAGVVGLLVSAAPDKTADEIEAALLTTAKQSTFATPDGRGHDLFYGFGQIVPADALRMLKPSMPPPLPTGCSCHVGGSTRGGAGLIALLAVGVALILRRRCSW